MSGFDIEMLGFEELQRELTSRLNPEKIVEPALQKGAEHLRDKLEAEVYKFGFNRRTGRSQDSMIIADKNEDGTISIGVSNQSTDAFYLYFHEWGTSKMRARPWLRPTFEREMNRIIEIMKSELKVRMRL